MGAFGKRTRGIVIGYTCHAVLPIFLLETPCSTATATTPCSSSPLAVPLDLEGHYNYCGLYYLKQASQVALVVKNLPANAGDADSIPGSGRSPREGHGNPLQYSCLENPMARGAW